MKNRLKQIAMMAGAVAIPVLAHAQEADTTISDTTSSMTSGFGLIKVLVLAVVTFGIILSYLKLLKKR